MGDFSDSLFQGLAGGINSISSLLLSEFNRGWEEGAKNPTSSFEFVEGFDAKGKEQLYIRSEKFGIQPVIDMKATMEELSGGMNESLRDLMATGQGSPEQAWDRGPLAPGDNLASDDAFGGGDYRESVYGQQYSGRGSVDGMLPPSLLDVMGGRAPQSPQQGGLSQPMENPWPPGPVPYAPGMASGPAQQYTPPPSGELSAPRPQHPWPQPPPTMTPLGNSGHQSGGSAYVRKILEQILSPGGQQ